MLTNIKIPFIGKFKKIFIASLDKDKNERIVIAHWVKVRKDLIYPGYFYYGDPKGMYLLYHMTPNRNIEFKDGFFSKDIPVYEEGNPYPIAVGHR